jgi:CBS domain-containing protein
MKVKDAMHRGVDWVDPSTPLSDLARLMREHDIVCKGVTEPGFDADHATARDVMTPGIHCCRDDDDLAKAIHHMEELQVRRLPVINRDKRMVGILSLGDISHTAPSDLLSGCVKSVSAHHH